MVLLGVLVLLEEIVSIVQNVEHLLDRHDKRLGGETQEDSQVSFFNAFKS